MLMHLQMCMSMYACKCMYMYVHTYTSRNMCIYYREVFQSGDTHVYVMNKYAVTKKYKQNVYSEFQPIAEVRNVLKRCYFKFNKDTMKYDSSTAESAGWVLTFVNYQTLKCFIHCIITLLYH